MLLSETSLEPLPYHFELRDYLKSRECELWGWFASARAQADYAESLRLELLKSTYRLDPAEYPELFQNLEAAKISLGLDVPVTMYQAQNNPHPNAVLCFLPGEAHIVFSGPVLTLLDAAELKSVLGHELAHHVLWTRDGGEFQIADRLIQAVAADPRASASHEQTARRYQLYTEIFADRGSLRVVGDIHPVVSGLVKIGTGLAQVSADGYLKQAAEIFASATPATEGLSHPESFIRARALALWEEREDAAAPAIAAMIEGAPALDDLDVLGQVRMTAHTRRLIEQLLRPRWFQTPAVLGHARQFFADLEPATAPDPSALAPLRLSDAKLRDYLCYVLLDFATIDPDLDDLPLAAALCLSQQLDLDPMFEKLAAKELSRRVRDVRRLKEEAPELFAKAEAHHA